MSRLFPVLMDRQSFVLLCWIVYGFALFIPYSPAIRKLTSRDRLKILAYIATISGFAFNIAWEAFAPIS